MKKCSGDGEFVMGLLHQYHFFDEESAFNCYEKAIKQFNFDSFLQIRSLAHSLRDEDKISDIMKGKSLFLLGKLYLDHNDILLIVPNITEQHSISNEILRKQKKYLSKIIISKSKFINQEEFLSEVLTAASYFRRAENIGHIESSIFLALVTGEEISRAKHNAITQRDFDRGIQCGLSLLKNAIDKNQSEIAMYHIARWYKNKMISEDVYKLVFYYDDEWIIVNEDDFIYKENGKENWEKWCEKETIRLFYLSACKKYPKACVEYAKYLLHNKKLIEFNENYEENDENSPFYWLKIAIDKNDIESKFIMAKYYEDKKQYKKAIELYKSEPECVYFIERLVIIQKLLSNEEINEYSIKSPEKLLKKSSTLNHIPSIHQLIKLLENKIKKLEEDDENENDDDNNDIIIIKEKINLYLLYKKGLQFGDSFCVKGFILKYSKFYYFPYFWLMKDKKLDCLTFEYIGFSFSIENYEIFLFRLFIVLLHQRISHVTRNSYEDEILKENLCSIYSQFETFVLLMEKYKKEAMMILAIFIEKHSQSGFTELTLENSISWWLRVEQFVTSNDTTSSSSLCDVLIPWKLSRISMKLPEFDESNYSSEEISNSPTKNKIKWINKLKTIFNSNKSPSNTPYGNSDEIPHQLITSLLHRDMENYFIEFISNNIFQISKYLKDISHLPLLLIASSRNDYISVELLIENDGIIDIVDENNNSPIALAAENNHLSLCTHLQQLHNKKKKERNFTNYLSNSKNINNELNKSSYSSSSSSSLLSSSYSSGSLKRRKDSMMINLHNEEKPIENLPNEILTEEHYFVHQIRLRQQLIEISEEDIISVEKKRIYTQLYDLGPLRAARIASDLKPLLKKLYPPENLYNRNDKKILLKLYNKMKKLTPKNRIFSRVICLVKEIDCLIDKYHSFEKPRKYGIIISALENIRMFYMKNIATVISTGNLPSPPVLIHSHATGTRLLKDEYISDLFPYYDTGKDTIVFDTCEEYGTHIIRIVNDIHFKGQPHAPGVEFMVDCLNKLLAGHGSAPTELVKIFMYREKNQSEMSEGSVTNSSATFWEKEEMLYLASKTVIGANLEFIISNHMNYILDNLLNPFNFTSSIISSLLTNPQDGKPDNYMVVIDVGNKGAVEEMAIIGIDNDIAFADPIIRKPKINPNEFFVDVRNVLYFFPQMKLSVDESFVKGFLQLCPELLIFDWLKNIFKKSQEYQQLLDDKILTDQDFIELNLPIKFVPGTVRNVYRKLKEIKKILYENPTISHVDLFSKLQPLLCLYYEKLLDSVKYDENDNLYKNGEEIPLACKKLYASVTEPISNYVSWDENILNNGITQSVREYLDQPSHIPCEFDFEDNRTVGPIDEAELFLASIDFSELDYNTQCLLIVSLSNLGGLTSIVLTNSSVSLSCIITACESLPQLSHVILENCPNVQLSDLDALKAKCSHIDFSINNNNN